MTKLVFWTVLAAAILLRPFDSHSQTLRDPVAVPAVVATRLNLPNSRVVGGNEQVDSGNGDVKAFQMTSAQIDVDLASWFAVPYVFGVLKPSIDLRGGYSSFSYSMPATSQFSAFGQNGDVFSFIAQPQLTWDALQGLSVSAGPEVGVIDSHVTTRASGNLYHDYPIALAWGGSVRTYFQVPIFPWEAALPWDQRTKIGLGNRTSYGRLDSLSHSSGPGALAIKFTSNNHVFRDGLDIEHPLGFLDDTLIAAKLFFVDNRFFDNFGGDSNVSLPVRGRFTDTNYQEIGVAFKAVGGAEKLGTWSGVDGLLPSGMHIRGDLDIGAEIIMADFLERVDGFGVKLGYNF